MINLFPINDKVIYKILLVYFLVAIVFCKYMLPCVDTFYYWGWSRNLQLSYLDGPPLIAITIRFMTSIFGNTVFALNLLGVIFISTSAYLVYKIVLLLSPNTLSSNAIKPTDGNSDLAINQALICSALWLLYPFFSNRFILLNVTYDGLELIFSLLTIYIFILYLQGMNRNLLYLLGISCGFLLLSKYSGIILILSLLFYCIIKPRLRHLFKYKELYLSIIICLVIFSPVIIWNYQNNWASFNYQLHTHLWKGGIVAGRPVMLAHKTWYQGLWFYLHASLLGNSHVLVIFLGYAFWCYKIKFSQLGQENGLLMFLILCNILFWLIVSPFAHVAPSYMLLSGTLLIIIVSNIVVQYNYLRLLQYALVMFFIIDVAMMVGVSKTSLVKSRACYNTEYNPTGTTCYNAYIVTKQIKY